MSLQHLAQHRELLVLLGLLATVLGRPVGAKEFQDPPAWQAREHLSWFIEDNMPSKYYQYEDDPASFGLASLGTQLSLKREWWTSDWPGGNAWMLDQLRQSPLRAFTREDADLIILPVMFRLDAPYDDLQAQFIEELPGFAPHIGAKPHIVILNHPMEVYRGGNDALYKDPRAQNITFLTVSPSIRANFEGGSILLPNVVGMPYLTRVHWTQYTSRTHQQLVDTSQIPALKKRLSMGSFDVRVYHDRLGLHRACTARPELCLFHNVSEGGWDEFRDAGPLEDLERASWYVLQPQGDFVTRKAWIDTLFAGSIPAVFDVGYVDHLPFTDLLDYSRIMTTLPTEWGRLEETENAIDRLNAQFDEQTALDQLSYIHEVLHVFQFSLNPAHELIRWDQQGHRASRDDAFTFTMKSLMRHLCKRPSLLLPSHCTPAPGARPAKVQAVGHTSKHKPHLVHKQSVKQRQMLASSPRLL